MSKLPDWLKFFFQQLSKTKGSLVLISLLTIAAALCGAAAPLLIGRIMDSLASNGGGDVVQLAVLLFAVMLLAESCSAVRTYLSSMAMVAMSYRLTEEMLAAVLHTSHDFFAKTPRGELLQRCTQDTKIVQKFGLATLPAFAQEVLLAAAALIVVVRWNAVLAFLLLGSFLLLFLPVHLYGRKRGAVRKELAAHDSVVRHSLLEKLDSLKQIKLYGIEGREFDAVASSQNKWADLMYRDGIVDSWYRTFPRIPDSLAPALVFLFAGWQMATGEASVGQLVTIIAYIPAINAPVRSFFGLYTSFADVKVRIEGILDYLRQPQEPGRERGLNKPAVLQGKPVIFKGVHVSCERGDLLRNLTFTISPGEHVAIVGPSGAGKSTLLKLLLRLQEPSAGQIRIGGDPVSGMDAEHLRQKIGYVMQENFLFRESLYENLTFLREAHKETVEEWMKAFAAGDIADHLPDGYESEIGQNGERLSGGQRQLVSLVRTLLGKPDMLLLDEATSALDSKSETAVLAALAERAAGITRLHVTHRLRGASQADRILVLDRGELVEEGTHEALLERKGLYARLWEQEDKQVGPGAAASEPAHSQEGAAYDKETISALR